LSVGKCFPRHACYFVSLFIVFRAILKFSRKPLPDTIGGKIVLFTENFASACMQKFDNNKGLQEKAIFSAEN
jgi:hypothetical protein